MAYFSSAKITKGPIITGEKLVWVGSTQKLVEYYVGSRYLNRFPKSENRSVPGAITNSRWLPLVVVCGRNIGMCKVSFWEVSFHSKTRINLLIRNCLKRHLSFLSEEFPARI